MPPKRRLSESADDADNAGSKKKKLDAPAQMQAVLDFVKKVQKRDGGLLCEMFMKVPGKLIAPGYHDHVKNPITIPQIQQKVKSGEYANMEQFKSDFYLVASNAKTYFAKDSNEFRIASELEHVLKKSLAAVANGDELVPSIIDREEDVLTEFLEELLGTVITACDSSEPDRNLSSVFQLLPSKRRYPEYYKVTPEPIDLKMIATKIHHGEYSSIGQMEEDLQLMFRNATSFNEPGSTIYKDAKVLSKLVKSKKQELDVSLQAKQNRGSRSSRRQSKQVYSTQLLDLQYEDSDSEEEEEEEEIIPSKGPLWEVYSSVRNFTTAAGVELAEAFLSLPSRRELPDYYQTITEPISLNQIKRKLKGGEYKNDIQLLAKDMDKMFENCKEYNRPDSKLYKDGAKLQKVMRSKVEELEGEDLEAALPPAANTVVEEIKKSPRDPKEQIRKRCKALYNAILNHTNSENERPIGAFMEKPDRKLYPDYYDIITEPMDMKTINEKIMTNVYKSEEEMMADCKQMFSNCRMYNEEGSEIYESANMLEKVLISKAKEMGIITEKLKKRKGGLTQRIKTLYDTLKDFRDAKGRQLSLIFLKLPSKHEYPDYYDIIKRPIDMEKISGKIRNSTYETLEDAVADFTLVFDNACKYNEPDSQIYKDAQTLQRLAHQTVRHLTEDDGVVDAKAAVQDILSNIYHTVLTAQDGEERCLVDSFTELPEHDEINGKKVRALTLEIIKRRIDRGLYKRLDLLQRDVFGVLVRARRLSRLDSQTWEDSVELQRIFIRARDQYGEKGARIQSKVYEYTAETLNQDLEAQRATKSSEPAQPEDEEDKLNESGAKDWSGMLDSSSDASQYHVGDFVYVIPEDAGMDPHIYHVERLFEREGGNKTIWARQFFRQRETFHVPTRTFYEKEVMQGDLHNSVPISKVLGKCIVMANKDYFKVKPEGFDEKDIYVCEWRYTSKIRNWKKIKPSSFWDYPDYIKMTQRDKPLEPKKVASVFKDRIEKHKEEVEEIEALEKVVEEPIPANIKWMQGPDPNLTYWEQYTIPGQSGPITVRRGDHVLVRGEGNRNMVAQIDTMWMGIDGMAYFNGPWYVLPTEMPPQVERKFYKAEAFLSTISDSNPLLSVVGKCIVLDYQSYCQHRPTQYNESDVYICESLFDEAKRLIRPLAGGLKKYNRSPLVQSDEIYIFPEPLVPEKEVINIQPQVTRASIPSPMLDMNEDSMDAPPSVGSVDSSSTTPLGSTMLPSGVSPMPKKKEEKRKKLVTAYILFSMDQRRITMDENPGVRFGEISRTIAEKWKQLSDAEKQVYGDRAKKYNEEKEREEQEKRRLSDIASAAMNSTLAKNPPPASSPGLQGQPGSPGGPPRMRQESGGGGMPGGPPPAGLVPAPPPNLRGDPLFHVVPPKPQRLLHSEAYIKYIEGLSKDTKTMCNWDKQLQATNQGSRMQDESKLPASWLSEIGEHTTSTEALWALRDFMMHEALGVVRIM